MKSYKKIHSRTPQFSFIPTCRVCRTLQRHRPRKAGWLKLPPPQALTKQQVVSVMYSYLMSSWEAVPAESKRAMGFDPAIGSYGEEDGLNYMAQLFREYADQSFQRALAARRRRLNVMRPEDDRWFSSTE